MGSPTCLPCPALPTPQGCQSLPCTANPTTTPTQPLLKELLSNVYTKVARAASCGRANFPGLMAGLLFIDPGSKLEDWVET